MLTSPPSQGILTLSRNYLNSTSVRCLIRSGRKTPLLMKSVCTPSIVDPVPAQPEARIYITLRMYLSLIDRSLLSIAALTTIPTSVTSLEEVCELSIAQCHHRGRLARVEILLADWKCYGLCTMWGNCECMYKY